MASVDHYEIESYIKPSMLVIGARHCPSDASRIAGPRGPLFDSQENRSAGRFDRKTRSVPVPIPRRDESECDHHPGEGRGPSRRVHVSDMLSAGRL